MQHSTRTATQAAETTALGLENIIVAETRLSEVDGSRGTLTVAGHTLAQLAERDSYESVCRLLVSEALPESQLSADVQSELGLARRRAHRWLFERPRLLETPDAISALSAAFGSFEFEQGAGEPSGDPSHSLRQTLQVVGLAAVVNAAWLRSRTGQPLLEPDTGLSHASDTLRLMHGRVPTRAQVGGLDRYWVSVAEHGLNASTFTARLVASTGSDLLSAVAAATGALKGPLHGGAPGPVLDMLDAIAHPENAKHWLAAELMAGRRIMGMGHRVYRVRDPRAQVLEAALGPLAEDSEALRARLRLARAVEAEAEQLLAGRGSRPLKANVEFLTALLLDALDIPRSAFSGAFAAGRAAGWCAHYFEQGRSNRLIRPRARYVGQTPD